MDEAMLDTWDIGTAPSELKGVIEAVDDILGVGVLTAANGSGQYLVFFLEDIAEEAGWQEGLAIGDCVEFDTLPSTVEERDLAQRSRECQRLSSAEHSSHSACKLEHTMIATNLRKLAKNSVVLDEPLWGHPRYLGVVEVPLVGDDITDEFDQRYREERVNSALGGMIRLTRAFPSSLIPTASQIYKRSGGVTESLVSSEEDNSTNDDSDSLNPPPPLVDEVDYLEESLCLTFDGSDLLSLRVLLEEGDLVEFDVYRNHRSGQICATNVVFVDAVRRDESTFRGIVTNVKHAGSSTPRGRGGSSSSKQSGPPIGGTIRILHEHSSGSDFGNRRTSESMIGGSGDPSRLESVNFPISEWLDRDEPIHNGDEVEFEIRQRHVMVESGANGRRSRGGGSGGSEYRTLFYAARILLCPKGYLTKFKYRPILSDWIEGEVRVDTSHPSGGSHDRRRGGGEAGRGRGRPSPSKRGNFERQCIVYKVETENDHGKKGMAECRVEIDKDSLRQQLLVAGDKVLFRILRSFVAPGPGAARISGQVINERAMHVVVKKAAPRRNFGRIYSLHVGRERYRHGVDDCTQITHGFIQLNGRDRIMVTGVDDELIYFKFRDWIDSSIDIFYGMKVEFNLLRTPEGETCAVRVRPSEWPQTCSEKRDYVSESTVDGSLPGLRSGKTSGHMRHQMGPDGMIMVPPSRGSRPPIPPTLHDRFGDDSAAGLDHSTSDTSLDPFGGDLYSNGGGVGSARGAAPPATSIGGVSDDYFRADADDSGLFEDTSSSTMRMAFDTIQPPPGLYASPPGMRRSDDPDRYDHPSTFDDELDMEHHRRRPPISAASAAAAGASIIGSAVSFDPSVDPGAPPSEGRPGLPLPPANPRSGRPRSSGSVYFADGLVTQCQWTSGGPKAPGGGPPEKRPTLHGLVQFVTPSGETRISRFDIDNVVQWQMRIRFCEKDRVLVQIDQETNELLTVELTVPRHTVRAHGVGVLAPDDRWVALKCAQIRGQGLVSMLFTQIMFSRIKRERKHFKNLIGTRFIFDLEESEISRRTGSFTGIRINPMKTIDRNVRGVVVKRPSEDFVRFPSVGRVRRYLPNGLICPLGSDNEGSVVSDADAADSAHRRTEDGAIVTGSSSLSSSSFQLMKPEEVKELVRKGPMYGFSMTDFMGDSDTCRVGTRIVFDLEIPLRAEETPRGSIDPSIFNVRIINPETKQILERSPPPINVDVASHSRGSRGRRSTGLHSKRDSGSGSGSSSSASVGSRGSRGSRTRHSRSGNSSKSAAVVPPRMQKEEHHQRTQSKRGKSGGSGSASGAGSGSSSGSRKRSAKGKGKTRNGSGKPTPEGSAGASSSGKGRKKGSSSSSKSKKSVKPKPIKDIPLKISGGQKWSKKGGASLVAGVSSDSPAAASPSPLSK